MNGNSLKRITLYCMAGIALLLVVWAIFGSHGHGEDLMAATAPEQPEAVQPEPRPEPEATQPEPEASQPEPEASQAASQPTALARPVTASAETVTSPEEETTPAPNKNELTSLLALLDPSDTIRSRNPYEQHFDSMPPGGIKLRINPLGMTLRRAFNDSNYLHIATAEKIGIKPVNSLRNAWEGGRKLQRLESCEAFYLDNLTHSLPYLVPKAHKLLTDIGLAFRDSLRQRGGGDYRVKVTSVLRTPRLVKRLRRRNRNAVDTSAHLYGTTFDISYAKFICDSTRTPRTQEDLKNLLGEVVDQMRRQGRCYVKYEYKQACFHITAR